MSEHLKLANTFDYRSLAKKLNSDFLHQLSELTVTSAKYFDRYLNSIVDSIVLPALQIRRGLISYKVKAELGELLQYKEHTILVDMELLLRYDVHKVIALLIAAYHRVHFLNTLTAKELYEIYIKTKQSYKNIGFNLEEIPDIQYIVKMGMNTVMHLDLK